jgi:hypothetical protein
MSIQERLTKNLAVRISRRGFIKGLGMLALALGTALIGKQVEEVAAESWCCQGTPECLHCLGGGSICPSGYHQETYPAQKCCLNHCQYQCLYCHDEDGNPEFCWCYHDDMTSCGGGYCGSKKGSSSKQSSDS